MELRNEEVLIRVESLVKEFDGYRALNGVSFDLKRGEILGLLGPNGAGKTTTLRILTGFFPPSRGHVWIHGCDLFHAPQKLKRFIGYLPEVVHLYPDMRAEEFLGFAAAVKGLSGKKKKADIEEKLRQCGLWDVRRRMIGKLSKGYRQRLGLAQALIGDPEVLILDEPTSGLDPKQIIEMRNLIRDLGRQRSLILSTHILPEASMVCDRVLIINKGKVVAGGTSEELSKGLRERHEIYVTAGATGDREGLLEMMRQIPGVERIGVLRETEGQTTLVIAVTPGRDVRAEISRLFVAQSVPLLEIRSAQLSLEEIFMKLVVEERKPS